jgi:hypothetical protein
MHGVVLSTLLLTTCQQSTVAKEVTDCRHLPRGIGKGYNLKEVTADFAWWVLFPNPPHYLYTGTVPTRVYAMQKQTEDKRSRSEDTPEQQLERDALHIIKTRNNIDYGSLKEIDLVEIMRTFPRDT